MTPGRPWCLGVLGRPPRILVRGSSVSRTASSCRVGGFAIPGGGFCGLSRGAIGRFASLRPFVLWRFLALYASRLCALAGPSVFRLGLGLIFHIVSLCWPPSLPWNRGLDLHTWCGLGGTVQVLARSPWFLPFRDCSRLVSFFGHGIQAFSRSASLVWF